MDQDDRAREVTSGESDWPVVYYRADDGTEPVNEFIDALEPKIQVVLDNQIERIALFGPRLPFPDSSQVLGALRELRCHYGNTLYRILYQRSDNLFVLLHVFEKRSGAILDADKQIAPRSVGRLQAEDGRNAAPPAARRRS